ncbi:MAG: PEP-CTERM sorting domain-containing protein [Opitutae bacterium]|nr:PEP-CTERM sorting domain-containing protein [Opitutae bacterium]
MVTSLYRPIRLVAGLLLAAFLATQPLRAQTVLVLFGSSSSTYGNDVVTKLQGSGLYPGGVTLAGNATPTLAQLQQYNAVLVFTDSGGFVDPIAVGNVLADYVDAGGGVVEAVFSNGSISITGRWQTGGYTAFTSGGQASGTTLTLGTVYDSLSPLLTGVTTFSGGTSSYYSTGSLRSGAIRVADWSNGVPLVAISPGFNGRIVSLNFFPPSSDIRSDFWDSSTNGLRLMTNSLNFVSIPEPSTCVLLSLGLVGLFWRNRRRLC